jgi:hypothetical protein
MTKMKLFMPLLVILIMGMTTSAFAQLTCGVASTPVSRATITGHTERAGDLTLTCSAAVGATPTLAATVTIDYGVPITDNTVYPVAPNNVSIASPTGSFAAAGQTPTISSVANSTGQVILNVPAQAAPADGTFTITNVLVSLNGSGKTSLSANVSVSPGSNLLITAGQNVATVITTILPGLGAPSLTGAAALFQGTGAQVTPSTNTFTVNVPENYIDSIRTLVQAQANINGGATNSTQVRWTFSNVPTGWGLQNCSAALSGVGGLATVPAASAVATSSGIVTLDVTFTGTDLAAVQTASLTCGTGLLAGPALFVPTGATAIATTSITATVTLAPTGAALSGTGTVLTTGATGQIPRFQDSQSAPLTVMTFTPATTTFLIPFATASGAAVQTSATFNTGIAIANSTADPASFGVIPNGPARDQSGTITFTMFPSDGSASFSVTSANVPLGGSLVTNLSQLLQSASPPITGTFTGYIIGVANFTNAHGAAFVYGGGAADRLVSATEVLVIPPPAVVPRTSLGSIAITGLEITTK